MEFLLEHLKEALIGTVIVAAAAIFLAWVTNYAAKLKRERAEARLAEARARMEEEEKNTTTA